MSPRGIAPALPIHRGVPARHRRRRRTALTTRCPRPWTTGQPA